MYDAAYKCPTCGKMRRSWRNPGVLVAGVLYDAPECWARQLTAEVIKDGTEARWQGNTSYTSATGEVGTGQHACPKCGSRETCIMRSRYGKCVSSRTCLCYECDHRFKVTKKPAKGAKWKRGRVRVRRKRELMLV